MRDEAHTDKSERPLIPNGYRYRCRIVFSGQRDFASCVLV